MHIKICGLTNLSDALHCCQRQIFAIGFNFYPTSPRYISIKKAKNIIQALPSSTLKIGIYAKASYTTLSYQIEELGLDLIQVYSPILDAPNSFKDKVILSLSAENLDDLPSFDTLRSYPYLLLDAPKIHHELPGGTGRQANWELAQILAKDFRLILAGGLNPRNAKEAIEAVNPYALDFASGVEISPGIKDKNKINHLLEVCHDEY